ncbi:MAG: DUF1385 domain-containing protein [Chloroflexi bacterium]|nr:DUF1385 domain-containing protein [Chloroflexota bacterium]
MAAKQQTAGEIKFSYGGQAVIEGVMMRGAHMAAVAVRSDKGEIVVHEQPLNKTLYRGRIASTPFLRGLIGLWDALGLGTRALMWSADVAISAEAEKEGKEISFNGPLGWGTVAVSLAFGIGLFFLLPTTLSTGIGALLNLNPIYVDPAAVDAASLPLQTPFQVTFGPMIVNLIENLIQLALIVGYMWLIGHLPDVKRLYGYHGAEHKTINAYEAGAELTPEVVAQYPIEHPRCGTAFLLTVVFISFIVFSLLGRPPFLLLILSRLILIPVIAGIAYEVIRWTAKNMHRPLVRLIVVPNLALQHLTTRPPDLQMIEVAIVAFKRVLFSEGLISEEEARLPLAPSPAPQPAPGD